MLKFKTKEVPLTSVVIPPRFTTSLPSPVKINACYAAYRQRGVFDRSVLVDGDKNLLDGYVTYLVAKMVGAETLRVVQITGDLPKKEKKKKAKAPVVAEKPGFKAGDLVRFTGGCECCVGTTARLIENVTDSFIRGDWRVDNGKDYPHDTWNERYMELVTEEPVKPRAGGGVGTYEGFPLVARPAEVGEWVYVTGGDHRYETKRIYQVKHICDDFGGFPNSVYFEYDGKGNVHPEDYLVVEGSVSEKSAPTPPAAEKKPSRVDLCCVGDFKNASKGDLGYFDPEVGAVIINGLQLGNGCADYEEWTKRNFIRCKFFAPTVKREAEVGEWVVATEGCDYEKRHGIKEGEIYEVIDYGLMPFVRTEVDRCTIFEYLVLDGYQPGGEAKAACDPVLMSVIDDLIEAMRTEFERLEKPEDQ